MAELRLSQPKSAVVTAWRPLAVHADGCDICLPYVQRIAGALDPRQSDYELYDELCEVGKAFFTVWRTAKDSYLAERWEHRRRQFLTDEQLAADGVSSEQRGQAIMSMPGHEFKSWLALPDDRRHAQLLALESGLRKSYFESHRCEGCGKQMAASIKGHYCSRACRLEHQ